MPLSQQFLPCRIHSDTPQTCHLLHCDKETFGAIQNHQETQPATTTATLPVEEMRGRTRLRMSKAANARVSCENCPMRRHQRATMWLGVRNQGSNRKNLSKRFRKEGKLAIKHQPSPAIVSHKYHIPRR